jgi:ATP-dependent DNA ligase
MSGEPAPCAPIESRSLERLKRFFRQGGPEARLIVQPKLDGCRLRVARCAAGLTRLYTKGGAAKLAWPHLIALFEALDDHVFPRDTIVECEFYAHGTDFNVIGGIFRSRADPFDPNGNSDCEIELHLFDLVPYGRAPDRPYSERQAALRALHAALGKSPAARRLILVPGTLARSVGEVMDAHAGHVATGYEGSVVKVPGLPRGADFAAMKIKEFTDDDFLLFDARDSSERPGTAVLELRSPTGVPFVVAWRSPDASAFVRRKDRYVGYKVKIRFQGRHPHTGVPRFAQFYGNVRFDLGRDPAFADTSDSETSDGYNST